jgi:transcriptional regulator with XRE-family HTH domain
MDGAVGFRASELARLRAARGLSLDALARAVGVSDRSRVAHWEAGTEVPQPKTLVVLARLFEVHPLELLEGGRGAPTLATLRSAAGLTRGQAAQRVGMSRPAYLRLDAGQGRRTLPPDLTAALAAAFGVEERVILNAHLRSRATPAAGPPTSGPRPAAGGQGMRELRRPHTAAAVADTLGITERSWYRIEAGAGRAEMPEAWVATLASLFQVTPAQIRSAYTADRRRAAHRDPRPRPASSLFDAPRDDVARRQSQLRIPLEPAAASTAADRVTARRDADRLARHAGLDTMRWIFTPSELAEITGVPTPAEQWGWSERAADPPIVYVDVHRCRTRGVVFGVLAHELTHLTHHGRRYSNHREPWWAAVQDLLDRAAD